LAIIAINKKRATKLDKLSSKRILLAICGGVAAYKSAELVRLLRKEGAEVRVAMTRSALEFVRPLTFQALSGNPVHTELLDAQEENAMGHINLARWAEAIVIAPATANTLAKCAHGMADELVTALFLAAECPVYIAPAMNQAMWAKPATQENIGKLQSWGVKIIGPASGVQACGETGLGRMSEPYEISAELMAKPGALPLKGIKVLISAGPTREYLDPVRYITNRSSGKMGYALAKAAFNKGAEVTLVSGPVALSPPQGIKYIDVETAQEMYEAVILQARKSDIYIGAAAVADYSPLNKAQTKLKKSADRLTIDLIKTKDILADVAALKQAPFTVGFAAETDALESYAQRKLAEKKLDMIAANWVGRAQGGFDSEQNALEVFWQSGRKSLPMTGKSRLAEQFIDLIAVRFNEKNRI
jgi:phosphopantothenoylcysteine decarboxylase/phosphopantothenate--cysteine ligase